MMHAAAISCHATGPAVRTSLHKIWYKSPDLLNEAFAFPWPASSRQSPNLTTAEKNITMPSQDPICYRKLAHA